jgi:hypothetical protein
MSFLGGATFIDSKHSDEKFGAKISPTLKNSVVKFGAKMSPT